MSSRDRDFRPSRRRDFDDDKLPTMGLAEAQWPGKGEERGMSGANKRGTFGVSLLSTTGVNRLLPAATAICPCPSRSQA